MRTAFNITTDCGIPGGRISTLPEILTFCSIPSFTSPVFTPRTPAFNAVDIPAVPPFICLDNFITGGGTIVRPIPTTSTGAYMHADFVRITQDCGHAGVQFSTDLVLNLPCPPLPIIRQGYGPQPGTIYVQSFTEVRAYNENTVHHDHAVNPFTHALTWGTACKSAELFIGLSGAGLCGGFTISLQSVISPYGGGAGTDYTCDVNKFGIAVAIRPVSGGSSGPNACTQALGLDLQVPRHVFEPGVCRPLMGTFLTLVDIRLDHKFDPLGPCREVAGTTCYRDWYVSHDTPCIGFSPGCFNGGVLYSWVNCSPAGTYKRDVLVLGNYLANPGLPGWRNFYAVPGAGAEFPPFYTQPGPTACNKVITAIRGLNHIIPGQAGSIVFNLEVAQVSFNLNHAGGVSWVSDGSTSFDLPAPGCSMADICKARLATVCSRALESLNSTYCANPGGYWPPVSFALIEYGSKLLKIRCGRIEEVY